VIFGAAFRPMPGNRQSVDRDWGTES
jgi:hypothetical protein